MKKLVIASKNPVKIQAALAGFIRMFPEEQFETTSVQVPSLVSDQPFSSDETLTGAMNRAQNARKAIIDADYWIGIEGGVEIYEQELGAFAWIVIQSDHTFGKARTGTFFLPPQVAELISQGKELGEADDMIFGRTNSKQDNGAIGILTGDVINRKSLYEMAVILALVPFKNKNLYPEKR
jgi:inosine/xanthosine triphosphatase